MKDSVPSEYGPHSKYALIFHYLL